MTKQYPNLGFGLGLRKEHYHEILDTKPTIDWFEILTENYLVPGGKPLYFLDKICEQYPIVMHGVSMNIGSTDPIDFDYLKQVKNLAKRTKAQWISDHLCWTGIKGVNLHDLLPLPYTEESLNHVVQRIKTIQSFLERPILIENVSSYITFQQDSMSEADFYTQVVLDADALMLVDINNIYVSGYNHNFDPKSYLDRLPAHKVQQFHLAGHSYHKSHIIDTHDAPIIDDVWSLYQYACQLFGPISTMIERDGHIPPLQNLLEELTYAKQLCAMEIAI